jgi:hypothetical protein
MITKFQLLMAFASRQPLLIGAMQFITIESIEHEDGSCKSFNVTGHVKDSGLRGVLTVHVRTID